MPSCSNTIRAENRIFPRRSPRFLCQNSNHENSIPPNFKLRTRSSSKSALNISSKVGLQLSVPCLRRSKRFQNHDEIVASGKNSCKRGATGVQKCTSAKASKISSSFRKSKRGCEVVTCKKSSRSASSRCRNVDKSSRRMSPMFSSQHQIEDNISKSSCNDKADRVSSGRVHKEGLTILEESGYANKCSKVLAAEKERDSSCSQFNSGGIVSANSRRDYDKTETKGKHLESSENDGLHEGWTKEQEMALNNAYLAARPTPHFWKNVAKMVPGKSAQECFDKVHSDNITTPQPRPASRTKQPNSLASTQPLSASKLLKGTRPKSRPITKQNIGKIRSLLQMNCQHPETDIFRLLEPTMETAVTTPHPSLRLRFASGTSSSSSRKRPISRFAASAGANLVSPPVLKPLKNPALHEKYISRLHYRNFKRKSSAAEREGAGVNAVRDAKNALIFDAKDVLCRFGNGEVNNESSGSEVDDDMMSLDGDEGDDLLMGIGFVR